MRLELDLQVKLEKRQRQNSYRALRVLKNLIDLTSNDYLGFARNKKLAQSIAQACLALAETGATGSRLLTGQSSVYEELEREIATYHRAETALLFNTGYMANLGLLSAVLQPEDTVFFDIHVHASTRDGIRLARALSYPFRHNDLDHLEYRLKKTAGRKFVCVESIYSFEGTLTPLKSLCDLCEKYDAYLIVDEAHATGVIGPQGGGCVVAEKCEERVFARIHTFSKALGVQGAAVLGSATLRNFLINYSNAFIYTTALPAQSLIAIRCAYALLPHAQEERAQLLTLQKALGSHSHIYPIMISGAERVKNLSQKLAANGLDVRPLLSPTVQQGKECLRVCLHAFNTIQEVEILCKTIS